MSKERASAVICATFEFRALVDRIAGSGTADPLQSARDLFPQNRRTVERWYTGANPIPRGVLVRLRGFVAAAERMREDLDAVRRVDRPDIVSASQPEDEQRDAPLMGM